MANTKSTSRKTQRNKQSKLGKTLNWFKPTTPAKGLLLFAIVFAVAGGGYALKRSFAASGDTFDIPMSDRQALEPSSDGPLSYGPVKETSNSKNGVTVYEVVTSGNNGLFYEVARDPGLGNNELNWQTARMGKKLQQCAYIRAYDNTKISMVNQWTQLSPTSFTYAESTFSLTASSTYNQVCSQATTVTGTGFPSIKIKDPSHIRIGSWYIKQI